MTKASDNAFPSILITEGTEPSAPAAGKQRLYIDSTTHHLKATNSSGTDRDLESGSGGYLGTRTEATLSGDVTMTTAGTFYDGPTNTPAAGVYDVLARMCLVGSGTNSLFTARLIANGSATPIDESEMSVPTSTHDGTIVLAARVTADGSNPILCRATSSNNSCTIKRDPVLVSSGIHRASLLVLTRVS
jgi:hypothetical protein